MTSISISSKTIPYTSSSSARTDTHTIFWSTDGINGLVQDARYLYVIVGLGSLYSGYELRSLPKNAGGYYEESVVMAHDYVRGATAIGLDSSAFYLATCDSQGKNGKIAKYTRY